MNILPGNRDREPDSLTERRKVRIQASEREREGKGGNGEREMDEGGEESSPGNIVAEPIAITYFE